MDPLFCAVASDDVSLRSDSQLLDAPGCGLIGARGQGCVNGPTAALADFSSVPAQTGIVLEWRLAASIGATSVRLDRAPTDIGPWTALPLPEAAGREGRWVDETAEVGVEYVYRLSAETAQGWRDVATSRAAWRALPREFGVELLGANPRARAPEFLVSLPVASTVDLRAFDVSGREVARISRESLAAGVHRVAWEGAPAHAAGIYFVRLDWGAGSSTSRVVLRP